MFSSKEEFEKYIIETYPEVTDCRIDDGQWDLECDNCGIVRGFQVRQRGIQYNKFFRENDFFSPVSYWFECPVCHAFKQWIVFHITSVNTDKDTDPPVKTRYFRVASLPAEGLEDIAELPEDPPELRKAYKEAIRAMNANAYLAAAAMFRRALQIITRKILGARPGTLAKELVDVVGKPYNGTTITRNFADIGYIIKDAGNQGAHPDNDIDLLDFTRQDAVDLQNIFMELVSDLFIVPAAQKKAKEDFLARRKIKPRL